MYSDFDELYSKYKPMILSIIKNTFIDGYTKEDLMQECLMIMHYCNQTFDVSKKVKFSTYLYTSVRNNLYNLIKKYNREKIPKIIYVDYDNELLLNQVQDNYDEIDHEEKIKLFSSMVDVLLEMPRGYVTYMIYVVGHTMKEVADIEGITEQRIHYLNKRNLKKLKEMFV